MINSTEQESKYHFLEKMSTQELLENINREDATVAKAVKKCIPEIVKVTENIYPRMQKGGRLFYIGAGTSGRIGIVDASECPPTFGVDAGLVIGIIAGGDSAIRKAVEFAEDDIEQGWKDLINLNISEKDSLIGLAASGTTPYVIGAIKEARKNNVYTACITCNSDTPLAKCSDEAIEVIVGPEFITGSTRMKAGTAQKMVINMISTTLMIRLGKVKGNKMVDMQLSNNKLVDRGTKMIMESLNISYQEANKMLLKHGSVRKVLDSKI